MPAKLTTDMLTETDRDLMDVAMNPKSAEKEADVGQEKEEETKTAETTTEKPAAADATDEGKTQKSAADDDAAADKTGKKKTDEDDAMDAAAPEVEEETKQQSTTNHEKQKKRKKRKRSLLLSDSIFVTIPLHVTADMRVPLSRIRKKRIQKIYKQYPALAEERKRQQQRAQQQRNQMDEVDDDDEAQQQQQQQNADGNAEAPVAKKNTKKKTVLPNIPKQQQFGSVLDYLEAKYTRGVMLNDEEDGIADAVMDVDGNTMNNTIDDGNDDGGDESVYSQSSFLDDTDLRRTVAEQVMANATMTKLELETEDGDFFVNVGNLEIENDEYVRDDYDPLQDQDDAAAPSKKTKKVRKKSDAAGTTSTKKRASLESIKSAKSSTTKKSSTSTPKAAKGDETKQIQKKDEKSENDDENEKSKNGDGGGDDDDGDDDENDDDDNDSAAEGEEVPVINDDDNDDDDDNATTTTKQKEEKEARKIALKQKVDEAKAGYETLREEAATQIKQMDSIHLPRFQSKTKVAVLCPPGRKPGDFVTFVNPTNSGQKLRVKVPKDCVPGGSFKVTVPVKRPPISSSSKDLNKFPREIQELLVEYARAFDDWCNAMGEYDKSFSPFKEKQGKYEVIASFFPNNLLTPIDDAYAKKLLRRSRQNRNKRLRAAALRQLEEGEEGAGSDSNKDGNSDADDRSRSTAPAKTEEKPDEVPSTLVKQVRIHFPAMGSIFPEFPFHLTDFDHHNASDPVAQQPPNQDVAIKQSESQQLLPAPPPQDEKKEDGDADANDNADGDEEVDDKDDQDMEIDENENEDDVGDKSEKDATTELPAIKMEPSEPQNGTKNTEAMKEEPAQNGGTTPKAKAMDDTPANDEQKPGRVVQFPGMGKDFPTVKFNVNGFVHT